MRLACCRAALFASALFGIASCADSRTAQSAASGPALAENTATESCTSKLSPDASSIYRAAAQDMRRDTDLPSLLREKIMPMVLSGQMRRSTARPAAEQAAACLQLLRH